MNGSRFQKFIFNNGKTAHNRVVIPPMASQTADASGFVTDATVAHYGRLCQAGAGLVFVEYSFVHQSGRGEANQLGVNSWDQIPGLVKIADTIHVAGSLAGLQLVHVGGKTSSKLTGFPLMGASAIPVPVKGWQPETPVAMTEAEIEVYIGWYVEAARRSYASGFDLVELHAAHGYGLNQWLSPLTNVRVDSFGGSIVGRSEMLLGIVKRIKSEVPNILVAVRLPGQDHASGGLHLSEMSWVAKQLELNGVDLIDVSSGIGGWRRTDSRTHQGYLVDDAATLRANLSIPVIGVGGIETGTFIDEIISHGKVDFAAVGRALLKDPFAWGEKHLRDVHRSAEVAS